MSAKKNSLNYSALVKNLRAEGPGRLYLLWGEEDYLRAQFLTELRRLCLPDGGNDFCDRRLDGSELDVSELRDSVDSLPFMSERSFIEVNGFELGSVRAPDLAAIEKIVADVPDYCTLVFKIGRAHV